MPGEFENYKQQREQDKENRERVAESIKPEWDILKSETQRLVLDGEEIDGEKFGWHSDGDPALILGNVAAIFQERRTNNNLTEYKVRFDRKPLQPRQEWANPRTPQFLPIIWSLTLVPVDEEVGWLVQSEGPPLTSSDLSDKIAVTLAQQHEAYKKYYENGLWLTGQGA